MDGGSSCDSPTTVFALLIRSLQRSACSEDEYSTILRDYVTREFNAFLWVSLIAITALLLVKVLKLFRLWVKARRIPGPPCDSFYGHTNLFSRGKFMDFLSDSHREHGSVVKLWLGPTQLLVSINDPVLIKEMLLKAEDKLPLTGRAFRLAFGRSSLFVSSFDEVQKRRESLAMELNGRLLETANVIPTKAMESILGRINENMGNGSVNCKMVSQRMAFTILGATLFGDAFLSWSKATFYEELLMTIAKDACFWASYKVTPFWKRGFWRYQSLCTKLKCLTQDIVQQCRKNYKLFCHMDQNCHNKTADIGIEVSSGASHCSGIVTPDNFLSVELDGRSIAKEEPFGNIMGLIFHGCLSVAGLIDNILAMLVMHPEIQEEIYSGIITARKGSVKQDRSVDKMPLLLATVCESARLLSAGPLLQRCSLKHDLNLKSGVSIPAGAMLVVPVQLVQKDDSSWGSDASKFNPYRFLSKTGKGSQLEQDTSCTARAEELVDLSQGSFIFNDPNDNAAFLPFGSGSRACVGQRFVIQGVATLFASLVEQYEIRLQPESETEPKPTINNSACQLRPSLDIVFTRRNS